MLETPEKIRELQRKLYRKAKYVGESHRMKIIGKPYSGKPNVRLCVQRRLVCSAGVNPAMVEVRRHIAWIARWRETKILEPIDSVTERVAASGQAVTEANAGVASKVRNPEGRAYNRRAKATWITENGLERLYHFSGVRATA